MRKMKQTRLWLLMVLILAGPAISSCNGGGVGVGYAPVSACGSLDFDPVECRQ